MAHLACDLIDSKHKNKNVGEKKRKGELGKVRARKQAGWRHANGALAGTTCTGTGCGQHVNHT